MAGHSPLRLAVFVGTRGRGSNLVAIHTAIAEQRLPAQIVQVIGSRPDAPALFRAQESGIPTVVVPLPKDDAGQYESAVLRVLAAAAADSIVLAGYLRRLPPAVVQAFPHRIINIHPSLLPAFGGKGMYGEYVHRAVIEYGVKVSGCTAHFVDEAYDTGPIIAQRVVPVRSDDTPATLAARILPEEHAALIESLAALAENRLTVQGRVVHWTDAAPTTE